MYIEEKYCKLHIKLYAFKFTYINGVTLLLIKYNVFSDVLNKMKADVLTYSVVKNMNYTAVNL